MRRDGRRLYSSKSRISACLLSAMLIVSMSVTTLFTMDVKKTDAVTRALTGQAVYEDTGDVVSKGVTVSKKTQKSLNRLAAKNAEEIGSTDINVDKAEFKPGTYGYDLLNANQRKLYDDFAVSVEAYVQSEDFVAKDYTTADDEYRSDANHYAVVVMSKTVAEYGCDSEEGMQVYFTFRHNNPQYFWISTTYYRGPARLTVLMDRYYADSAKRQAVIQAMRKGVADYIAMTANYDTKYDKVKAIHDDIINKVEYAYNDAGNPESSIWAHCVAGVFVKYYKAATEYGVVCEGYSKALQLVLNQIGINNVFIVGTAGGGGHAWNAVEMDNGTYYYIDSTWDDLGAGENGGISYTEFCVPKTYFEKKHNAHTPSGNAIIATWLYKLPVIGNTLEYTYYARNHAYFEGVKTEEEAESLLEESGIRAGEYMQVLCTDFSTTQNVCWAWNVGTYYSYPGLGYLVIAPTGKYAIKTPATSVTITPEASTVDKGGKLKFTAKVSSGSDDKIAWSVEGEGMNLLSAQNGKSVTITFNQIGEIKVTATTFGGGVSDSVTVTVTDPNNIEGYSAVAWANGKTYIWKKNVTNLADDWESIRGTKPKGKLGWIVLSTDKVLQFDPTTKALLTKQTTAEKKMASITSNGVLTAKLPGAYRVHIYDTGAISSGQAPTVIKEVKVTREEAQTKTVTLTPNIKATNWYNANHKLQKGRILWIAKAERTKIEFNEARRTLATKTTASDKLIGTVNSKGVVSGKNAGILYVYACDTGTMHVEEFVVKVKNAPSAVKLSRMSTSVAAANLVKTLDLKVGKTSKPIYVIGTYNNKKVDASTDYSISVPEKYKDYIEVSKTICGDKEAFTISSPNNDKTAALSGTAKITVKVTNRQSKKTVNCIVSLSK